MKSLLVKLGVILIGLAIFGYAETWGADWKLYFIHDLGLFYYDSQGITRLPKSIIRVWVKYNFTEKGIVNCVNRLGKEYENVSHIMHLIEINCLERKSRHLKITYYDNKGGVIFSSNAQGEYEFITPESMGENLYKEVCK